MMAKDKWKTSSDTWKSIDSEADIRKPSEAIDDVRWYAGELMMELALKICLNWLMIDDVYLG